MTLQEERHEDKNIDMLEWPSTLPYMDIGWSYKPGDNILRSSPERGPSKTRRKSTAKTDEYTGNLVLSSSELDIFLYFVDTTIKGGALSFYHPDWVSNQTRLCRLKSYSISQKSIGLYSISLTLEVLP